MNIWLNAYKIALNFVDRLKWLAHFCSCLKFSTPTKISKPVNIFKTKITVIKSTLNNQKHMFRRMNKNYKQQRANDNNSTTIFQLLLYYLRKVEQVLQATISAKHKNRLICTWMCMCLLIVILTHTQLKL